MEERLRKGNRNEKGVKLKEKAIKELQRRYQIRERGTTTVSTFLRTKIQVATTKIKNFVKSSMTSRQNKLFQTNQSRLKLNKQTRRQMQRKQNYSGLKSGLRKKSMKTHLG